MSLNLFLKLKNERDLVVKRLNEMPGISCPNPKGAFYAFPKIEDNRFGTDKEFVTKTFRIKRCS